MKQIIIYTTTLILSVAIASCSRPSYKSVEAPEFEHYIADTACVLLDVRTAQEYNEGHINKAINIDVKQDSFASATERIIPKNKTVALYCRSGKRSKIAAETLSKSGFNIIELNSGYRGWMEYTNKKGN